MRHLLRAFIMNISEASCDEYQCLLRRRRAKYDIFRQLLPPPAAKVKNRLWLQAKYISLSYQKAHNIKTAPLLRWASSAAYSYRRISTSEKDNANRVISRWNALNRWYSARVDVTIANIVRTKRKCRLINFTSQKEPSKVALNTNGGKYRTRTVNNGNSYLKEYSDDAATNMHSGGFEQLAYRRPWRHTINAYLS